MTSRREFVFGLGAAAVTATVSRRVSGMGTSSMRVGCAAITWKDDDRRAIDDISALGYGGIQLRGNVLTGIGASPQELRRLLAKRRLTFVALSSGTVSVEPDQETRTIDEHLAHARWLRDAGGLFLQLIDERPRDRAIEPADFERLSQRLTRIGQQAADVGIPVAYHPHMGSLGESPADVARVLRATDPKVVRLLLDVAHWQQGGGDPIRAIHDYRDRLALLHIKDVQPRNGGYQFVELGRGTVDLRGVFRALRDVGFDGWVVVELDSVPDASRTPAESASVSKQYLENVIGLRVSESKP